MELETIALHVLTQEPDGSRSSEMRLSSRRLRRLLGGFCWIFKPISASAGIPLSGVAPPAVVYTSPALLHDR